jgi:hypothetical protein
LGGGIYNDSFGFDPYIGTVTLRNTTILGNTATIGGDIYNRSLLFIYDSIIGDLYNE